MLMGMEGGLTHYGTREGKKSSHRGLGSHMVRLKKKEVLFWLPRGGGGRGNFSKRFHQMLSELKSVGNAGPISFREASFLIGFKKQSSEKGVGLTPAQSLIGCVVTSKKSPTISTRAWFTGESGLS